MVAIRSESNFDPRGALSLRTAQPLDWAQNATLDMWIQSLVDIRVLVSAQAVDTAKPTTTVAVELKGNQWTQVSLSSAQLGYVSRLARLTVQLDGDRNAIVIFDQIQFTDR